MKTALICIICIACLTASAKSDKKQKEIKNNYLTCNYTIDKKSKLKDGEYIKIKNSNHDTLVIGQYQNDHKTGSWKYRSTGKKDYIVYNYDKQTVEFMDPAISKIDSFLVKEESNGIYFLNKVDFPPVYLGFKGEVKNVLARNIRLPLNQMREGLHGTSTASFVIDRTGKIDQIKIERSLCKSFDETIIDAIKMLDSEWLPAKVNNTPTDAKMNIIVRVYNGTSHPKSIDKPYEIAIDLVYYGVTRTYTTTRIISTPSTMMH